MLQRSIQRVLELTSRACGKLIEMDVTTKIPVSWSCLKANFQHNTWKWLSEVEKIISRLWNYCACHTKAGVTFAPTLGSHSPPPPNEAGANVTPHEVGANVTPVPGPAQDPAMTCDRISSGSSQHLLTRISTISRSRSSCITGTSKSAPWNFGKVVIEGTSGRTVLCEPASSTCTWANQKSHFMLEFRENAGAQDREYRKDARAQDRDARFAGACAVQMDMGISQERFYARIYARFARAFTVKMHILWRPGWHPLQLIIQEPVEILKNSFLRGPCRVLVRRSCGDPGRILCKRTLPEDPADAMS